MVLVDVTRRAKFATFDFRSARLIPCRSCVPPAPPLAMVVYCTVDLYAYSRGVHRDKVVHSNGMHEMSPVGCDERVRL